MEDVGKPPQSIFVTVLAWIFIAFTGFATFISLLQNIMIGFMLPVEEMNAAFSKGAAAEEIPAFARFMFSNIRIWFAAFFVIVAALLATSIGLLKRKNWARISFIAFMGLGIAWNVFGLVMQHVMLSSFPTPTMPVSEVDAFSADFESMRMVMQVFMLAMAVGMSVLFGWIIKRLVSPQVRAEFEAVQF